MPTTMTLDRSMYLTRLKPGALRPVDAEEVFRIRTHAVCGEFPHADAAEVRRVVAMEACRELTADEAAIVDDQVGRERAAG